MNPSDTLADRLKTSAEAKKALLAQFRPRAASSDPLFEQRPAMRTAELLRVRQDRAEAKAAKIAAAEQSIQDSAQAELDAKRGERKLRKALTKAEAKEKRDARYAARKARGSRM